MGQRSIFFAGGGTGGHIYPALAAAESILRTSPDTKIHFFCSSRPIDEHILSQTDFEFSVLDACGLRLTPLGIVRFLRTFRSSFRSAKQILSEAENAVVLGIGGFVAAPVCYAAKCSGVPVKLLNVDIVPGKANRVIARWADEVFVQFEQTADCFKKANVTVSGCPLRESFKNPRLQRAREELGLEKNKQVLLITGASSGSQRINEAVCENLKNLDAYADRWQIVHLTGLPNFETVCEAYSNAKISHKIIAYYDSMPDLLACADLLIGRSGAVSVAEYAAAGVACICMPYPFHKDMHQYRNAGELVRAGAAIIVDDVGDLKDRSEWLWEELEPLLKDDRLRGEMRENAAKLARLDAADVISEHLLR